jgi:hypothetical protein
VPQLLQNASWAPRGAPHAGQKPPDWRGIIGGAGLASSARSADSLRYVAGSANRCRTGASTNGGVRAEGASAGGTLSGGALTGGPLAGGALAGGALAGGALAGGAEFTYGGPLAGG